MRKILLSSIVLCFFSVSIILFQLSCSKQTIAQSTTSNSSLKFDILVKNKWKVQEVMSNFNCNNLHFIDGGINTTSVDYTKFQLTFNADSTGTYKDESGYVFSTKWKFTSPDFHNMECKVYNRTGLVNTFNWNMVEISDSSFQSITAITIGSNNILQSTRYVPVP
jgi:hypothetical protein